MSIEDSKKNLLQKMIGGDDFSITGFVNCIQGFLIGLKLTHWETTSYELHKAVEQTQSSLEELLDDFVEAYIGHCGGKRPVFESTIVRDMDTDKLIGYLKKISINDTSLLNIRDEMLQTLYKFKYLKTLV